MMAYMVESIIIAFVMGGIFGAITAVHLTQPEKEPEKAPIKIRKK